jgi:hypothetical protein
VRTSSTIKKSDSQKINDNATCATTAGVSAFDERLTIRVDSPRPWQLMSPVLKPIIYDRSSIAQGALAVSSACLITEQAPGAPPFQTSCWFFFSGTFASQSHFHDQSFGNVVGELLIVDGTFVINNLNATCG